MLYIHLPWIYREDLSQHYVLCNESFRHLVHVLRISDNSEVVSFDGQGKLRLGRLHMGKKTGEMEFIEPVFTVPFPKKSFNLVQLLPNNVATFEDILRKACELGIQDIYPVLGERTESVNWRTEIWHKRRERFRRILQESCKQAKNPFMPRLHDVVRFERLEKETLGRCYFGSLGTVPETLPLFQDAGNIACFVGPEGGFSQKEETTLMEFATPVQLPTCVLRVETAVVGLFSVLKTIYK